MLSQEQRDFFDREGYLLIPGVFQPDEVERLLKESRRVLEVALKDQRITREEYYHPDSFKVSNILRRSRLFDHLIDHPGYFGIMVSLIGHHIQLMGSELFVRGSSEDAITGFHTDLGESLQQILPADGNLYLQIKAQIFLTDLSNPDSSNFLLIPGSHKRRVSAPNLDCMIDELNEPMRTDKTLPRNAVQVLARPGDVLLFPWTLWHAVAPNRTRNTRMSITLRYGQLCLRAIDRLEYVLADMDRDLTPRQRRVLGELGPSLSVYKPKDQRALIDGENVPI
jgi:ectoine hydroxylase-related dioxygenase (phytanoyl-CoA dioxygenase family)